MKFIQQALLTVALLPALAMAQVQVLGVEIAATTSQQLKSKLPGQARLTDGGVNKFSGGRQFTTDGAGYGIDSLNEVTYIFDAQDKLAAVLMQLGKERFDDLFNTLSSKYKLTAQQRPFVGNKSARFTAKGAVVELDAPHLSFVMDVRYVRDDLMKSFLAQSKSEAQQKKAAEQSKF